MVAPGWFALQSGQWTAPWQAAKQSAPIRAHLRFFGARTSVRFSIDLWQWKRNQFRAPNEPIVHLFEKSEMRSPSSSTASDKVASVESSAGFPTCCVACLRRAPSFLWRLSAVPFSLTGQAGGRQAVQKLAHSRAGLGNAERPGLRQFSAVSLRGPGSARGPHAIVAGSATIRLTHITGFLPKAATPARGGVSVFSGRTPVRRYSLAGSSTTCLMRCRFQV